MPRPRSRTPSPARRPGGYDSPGRGSPRRGTGSPTARDAPPLPFSTAARAEEDAFPSLFGLQFHRILWRSRGERDATDRWLALWKAVVLGGIVAMLLAAPWLSALGWGVVAALVALPYMAAYSGWESH